MAKLSRETQAMVGHPPDCVFKQIVSNNNPKNCRIEVHDVSNALSVVGPNCNRLEGMSTRQKPKRVNVEYSKILRDFYRLHKSATLTMDVMFVNGIPLFVTFS